MLQRLIALVLVKASNTSHNLFNETWQIFYSLQRAKGITKNIHCIEQKESLKIYITCNQFKLDMTM